MERPPNFWRLVAEFLLYVAVVTRIFGVMLGLQATQGLMGALTCLCGIGVFGIMKITGEKVPFGVIVFTIIYVMSNFAAVAFHGQLPVFGGALRPMLFALMYLTMVYFVIQNRQAYHRFLLVMSVCVLGAVVSGGVAESGIGRLEVEDIAGGFSNSNALAYLAGALSVALLFWSLEAQFVIRPVIWAVAGAMFVVLIWTVSRGGLLAFASGLAVFVLCIAVGRGMRVKGLVLVGVAAMALAQGGYMLTTQVDRYTERFRQQRSVRVDNFIHVWEDLPDTLLIGRGDAITPPVTATGVSSHNTFFTMHIQFGGPMAYLYLTWIGILTLRGWRMLRLPEIPFRHRMEVLAVFGIAIGCQLLSNHGHYNFGAIIGLALADKYTAPFSTAAIRRRFLAARQATGQYAASLAR